MPDHAGPVPDRYLLVSRPWRLTGADPLAVRDGLRGFDPSRAEDEFFFLLDGRIGGLARGHAVLDGADRWDLRGGAVILLDRSDRTTARFCGRGSAEPATGDEAPALAGTRLGDGAGLELLAGVADGWEPGDPIAPVRSGRARARRNLVVVHAGRPDEATGWVADLADEDRNWDLCLSWHDDPAGHADRPEAQFHVVQHGLGKWRAMFRLLAPASPFRSYDHVMLADDGLGLAWSAVNRAFRLARDHDLLLAHPAERPGEDADPNLASDPARLLRFVDRIATRAPVFSNEALAACAVGFGREPGQAGRGADWSRRLGHPLHRIAILDEVIVAGRLVADDMAGRRTARDGPSVQDPVRVVGAIDRDRTVGGGQAA